MEQRISLVTLGVKDLQISKAFYANGLGWKPAYESEEVLFYQTGGMIFALFQRDQLAADFNADSTTFGPAALALAHNVRTRDEVEPILQKAISVGGKLLKPARQAEWGGYSGYFADPDGFAWEIAWNPGWKIAPDGSIELG